MSASVGTPPSPVPTPGTTGGRWLAENWLTIFISVILSGVFGFFAAIFSVRSEIADLRDRVSKVETQVNSTVIPKLAAVDEHSKSITSIQDSIAQMQRQTDISIQTNKILDLRIETEREELAKELNKFFDEMRNRAGQVPSIAGAVVRKSGK